MRMLLTFLALAAVPALGFAQRSAFAEKRCAESPSHIEMRDCLEQLDAQSRREVEEAQRELLAELRRWDREPEYRQATADALGLAISRFGPFRDAQCEYVASLAMGGNAASDRRLLCLIDLNEQRARQLRLEIERLR